MKQRKELRLKHYDYSSPGMYFVTVCVKDRKCLLGEIENSQIRLSAIGEIVMREWQKLAKRFGNVKLDEMTIMPNHVHGIIQIVGRHESRPEGFDESNPYDENAVGAQFIAPGMPFMAPVKGSINRTRTNHRTPTLGEMVRTWKAASAREIHARGYKGFIWQRGYHEHVIRNEKDLFESRQYVQNNPKQWELDEEYVTAVPVKGK